MLGGGPSTPWSLWVSQARARPLLGTSTAFQVLLPAQQQGKLGLVPSGWGSAACVASGALASQVEPLPAPGLVV